MNIDKAIKLAEAATPGPWEVQGVDDNGQPIVRGEPYELATLWHHCVGSIEKEAHANAAHIARFDPPTVLALLRFVKAWDRSADDFPDVDLCVEAMLAVKAARAAVGEALK